MADDTNPAISWIEEMSYHCTDGPGLFWLSFADDTLPEGSQFLGACLVQAANLAFALTKTHVLGINPGGEIAIVGPLDLDPLEPPPYPLDRLLTRAEIEEIDRG